MFTPLSRVATSMLIAASLFATEVTAETDVYGPVMTGVPTKFHYHRSGWVLLGSNQSGNLYYNCPTGHAVVSGGFRTRAVSGNSSDGFHVIHSYPTSNRQWHLRLRNKDDIARDVLIHIVCAR